MKILIGCNYSGTTRRAFRALGHDCWSCDIIPSEDNSPYHLQGDVLKILDQGWDMLIGHPPCTHLSLSGARWLTDHWVKRKSGNRWHDGTEKRRLQAEAAVFFRTMWEAKIPRICLENPMSMASTLVCKKTQTIHPWQFGHGERKETWLWLKNLPPLVPTNIVSGREQKVWSMPPGPDRAKERARCYQGIADAMAAQWGSLPVLTQ